MISPFKKLPVAPVSIHIIIDVGEWQVEKEYAELGMRKRWLIKHRVRTRPNGSRVFYYLYPDSYKTE